MPLWTPNAMEGIQLVPRSLCVLGRVCARGESVSCTDSSTEMCRGVAHTPSESPAVSVAPSMSPSPAPTAPNSGADKRAPQGWPFKYMPAYFDFEEVMEMTDEQTRELMRTKRAIFAAQPHGVFTFGGACSGVTWGAGRFYHPKQVPTAVANVVMQTPFIKHIVGIFGICDASAKTLKKTLKKQSVVLYPGGIAELFLCDHETEKVFVHKRKGFVKVALQSGVDIVPVYFFGNTQILKVAKPAVLRWLARTTGISLTWFWGVGGLPIPFPRKITVAVRACCVVHSSYTYETASQFHLRHSFVCLWGGHEHVSVQTSQWPVARQQTNTRLRPPD